MTYAIEVYVAGSDEAVDVTGHEYVNLTDALQDGVILICRLVDGDGLDPGDVSFDVINEDDELVMRATPRRLGWY